MKRTPQFKIGDRVTVIKLPLDLDDHAGINTPEVFRRALGKTFRIEGIGAYGHLELEVTKSDTIWIEPEFVTLASKGRAKK